MRRVREGDGNKDARKRGAGQRGNIVFGVSAGEGGGGVGGSGGEDHSGANKIKRRRPVVTRGLLQVNQPE